ncbi:hypothetical protein FOZ62_007958, partial [Perkinsus olseni]
MPTCAELSRSSNLSRNYYRIDCWHTTEYGEPPSPIRIHFAKEHALVVRSPGTVVRNGTAFDFPWPSTHHYHAASKHVLWIDGHEYHLAIHTTVESVELGGLSVVSASGQPILLVPDFDPVIR